VVELHEKSRISALALSGNYGFVQASIFMDYYMKSIFPTKEKFISSVVSEMVRDGIEFKLRNVIEYFSLGTPEEISNVNKRILNFQ
jgi:hypothetical protein